PTRGASVFQPPGTAQAFIGCGIQRVRLAPVDYQIDRTRSLVDVEDFLPGGASVRGFEYAPLCIRREEMTHRRDVNDLRISGMNRDPGDVMRTRQAHVLPVPAAIERPVDAVSRIGAASARGISRPHPDDLAVGGSDGERSDRRDVFPREDRYEGCSVVSGL